MISEPGGIVLFKHQNPSAADKELFQMLRRFRTFEGVAFHDDPGDARGNRSVFIQTFRFQTRFRNERTVADDAESGNFRMLCRADGEQCERELIRESSVNEKSEFGGGAFRCLRQAKGNRNGERFPRFRRKFMRDPCTFLPVDGKPELRDEGADEKVVVDGENGAFDSFSAVIVVIL